jgi:biopolymer transport protein TolR
MAHLAVQPGRIDAEPNVIPMIDILLVLLMIFFVLSLRLRPVVDLQMPAPVADPGLRPQIVLELTADGGVAINGQPVPDDRLDATLRSIYAARPVKLLFVKAAGTRTYQEVVSAMDRARGAGVEVIGLVPQ